MPKIFRAYHKDNRGILRPTRRQVPTASRRGVAKVGGPPPDKVAKFKSRSKPIGRLADKSLGDKVRICIQRKLGGIGDVLMTTPLAVAFKQKYPGCEFTYATRPELFWILQGNPYIDHIVHFEKVNPADYHLFADVTSTGLSYENTSNPPRNRIDLFADYIGIRLTNPKPVYVVSPEEKAWAQQFIQKRFGERAGYKLAFIDISSNDVRRNWPLQHSITLIGELAAARRDIRFVVNDYHKKYGKPWDLKGCLEVGAFGPRQQIALLGECDLFVGPDSGILHAAGALEKEIVATFGSTPPQARINHYRNAISVCADIECKFCFYKGCRQDFACMKQISPQKVRDACMAKLEDKVLARVASTLLFDIYTLPPSDPEATRMASNLHKAIGALGLNTRLNPPDPERDSITIDIVKTSLLTRMDHQFPQEGRLRVGFFLTGESTLSKEGESRVGRLYGLHVTSDSMAASVIQKNGNLQVVYPVGLPVPQGLPVRVLGETPRQLGAIVPYSKRANLPILLKAFEQARTETGMDLQLKVLAWSTPGTPKIPTAEGVQVTVKPFFLEEDYGQFWGDLDLFLEPSVPTLGVFLREALARGIPAVGTQVHCVPQGLYYTVSPTGKEKPVLYEENGGHLGVASVPTTGEWAAALASCIGSYRELASLSPRPRRWIMENSSLSQARGLVNLIRQRIS